MDKFKAREILGVSKDASFEEIRDQFRKLAKKYHPDPHSKSDTNQFILISTAYTALKSKQIGKNFDENFFDDILYVLDLKSQIGSYFDNIFNEFQRFRDRSQKQANKYLEDIIFSSQSSRDLEKVLQTQGKEYLIYMCEEFKLHLKEIERTVERHIGTHESDFLFKLFEGIYKENRRNWRISLYRNPVVIVSIVCIVCLFLALIIKEYPDIHNTFPKIWALASLWWLTFVFLSIGMIIILVQYKQLNPRKKFQPLRFSVSRFDQLIESQVSKIEPTLKEASLGGAIFGALAGTFIFPGGGTLIGAALGLLFRFAGRDLQETQTRTYKDLTREINVALEQITNLLSDWVTRSKAEIYDAVVKSFSGNCRNVAGLIRGGHLPVQKLINAGKPEI